MTIDNIFRYIMCNGSVGGIIIAENLEDALSKLQDYIKQKCDYMNEEEKKSTVWKLADGYNNDENVFEIFNE